MLLYVRVNMSERTVIVYPEDDSFGGVCVMVPNLDCGLTVEEIAQKDVPVGRPYVFVSEAELPDPSYREAWDCDFSQPDGHGLGYDAFMAAKEAQRVADEHQPSDGGGDRPA